MFVDCCFYLSTWKKKRPGRGSATSKKTYPQLAEEVASTAGLLAYWNDKDAGSNSKIYFKTQQAFLCFFFTCRSPYARHLLIWFPASTKQNRNHASGPEQSREPFSIKLQLLTIDCVVVGLFSPQKVQRQYAGFGASETQAERKLGASQNMQTKPWPIFCICSLLGFPGLVGLCSGLCVLLVFHFRQDLWLLLS